MKNRYAGQVFMLCRFWRKSWELARQGQFARLWRSIVRYIAHLPRRENDLVSTLRTLLQNDHAHAAMLIVDHDIEGGANRYREEMIASLLARGEHVFVLTFYAPTLEYVLEYRSSRSTKRFVLKDLWDVLELSRSGLVREIFYNNCVSFHDPIAIPNLLIRARQIVNVQYRIAVHDYFSICPSHTLINDAGRYCGLPSVAECNRCLAHNKEGFVPMIGLRDIASWRESWSDCLKNAEEIICFSNTSRKLLETAYPRLSPDKISLRPHTLTEVHALAPKIDISAPLHIGVVGHITAAKGATILQALTDEIARRGVRVPVTVIGTVDAAYRIPRAKQTGPYHSDALVHLIEKTGANLFLFPSIWPETFSYVIAELMALEVPIACFDLGAPAERIANYPLGRVIARGSPQVLLDELLSFHAWLKQRAVIGERH